MPNIFINIIKRPVIYFRPFPYIYSNEDKWFHFLPISFNYYLTWITLLIMGIISPVFLAAGAIMASYTILNCAMIGLRGIIENHISGTRNKMRRFYVISALTFIWPVARGLGHIWGFILHKTSRNIIASGSGRPKA